MKLKLLIERLPVIPRFGVAQVWNEGTQRALQLVLLSFVLLPGFTLVYLSLITEWRFPDLLDVRFTSRNWIQFADGTDGVIRSAGLSALMAVTLSGVCTLLGFVIAQYIALELRSTRWLLLAFFPYLIAPVVFGVMLQNYFARWGLTGNLVGVMLGQAFIIAPYSMLLFSTFWSQRIRKMVFQTLTLGASLVQINTQIILPMARPWIFLSLIQCFLISWFEYGLTQVIGVGKVQTLTIRAMHFIREANLHLAATCAVVLVGSALLLFIALYGPLKTARSQW